MIKRVIPTVMLVAMLIGMACRKDKAPLATGSDCVQLRNGIVANDKEAVKEVINNLISKLPDRKYTPSNLNKLMAAMDQQCQIYTALSCFTCIDTLPPQSEIGVRVTDGGVLRVIDLTEDANGNIIFVNMHD